MLDKQDILFSNSCHQNIVWKSGLLIYIAISTNVQR